MKIFELFSKLKGTWIFKRKLTSSTGISLGIVEGKATFTPIIQSDTLHYKEEGDFINSTGQKMNAYREYLYIYNKEKDEIEKHFSTDGIDTGLFYLLNFKTSEKNTTATNATGNHLCNKDTYKAKYDFLIEDDDSSFSNFKLEYKVTGPEKDYISITEYEKSTSKANY